MKKYTFKKEFKLDEQDIVDLIDMAIEGGIGYWCCIGNDTQEWDNIREEYPDACIDEELYRILEKGESVVLFDKAEDREYKLTMQDLLNGIQTAINKGYWDGDIDSADAESGDSVFQCAIFGELIYG